MFHDWGFPRDLQFVEGGRCLEVWPEERIVI